MANMSIQTIISLNSPNILYGEKFEFQMIISQNHKIMQVTINHPIFSPKSLAKKRGFYHERYITFLNIATLSFYISLYHTTLYISLYHATFYISILDVLYIKYQIAYAYRIIFSQNTFKTILNCSQDNKNGCFPR